jgi:hypothetical protein
VTLGEIKGAVAAFLHKSVSSLSVQGVDLGLQAMNQVRMNAELNHDFGFTRKFLTLSVDGVTGASLDDAVEYGTTSPPIVIKSIVDVGVADASGNFMPAYWTTAEDSLNIQREDNPRTIVRVPTDAQAIAGPIGGPRFVFAGNKVFYFPRSPNVTIPLLIIAHTFTVDWTADDFDSSNIWTTRGAQYLQWKTTVHMNNLWRDYVFRQEGNLPPPQTLADEGLANLISWDIFKYEQFRRHSR